LDLLAVCAGTFRIAAALRASRSAGLERHAQSDLLDRYEHRDQFVVGHALFMKLMVPSKGAKLILSPSIVSTHPVKRPFIPPIGGWSHRV
jgi:hypothetical protein